MKKYSKCPKTSSGKHYIKKSTNLLKADPDGKSTNEYLGLIDRCVACGMYFDK